MYQLNTIYREIIDQNKDRKIESSCHTYVTMKKIEIDESFFFLLQNNKKYQSI